MTTLIAAYNGDGCIGQCDAQCFDAVESVCRCICGGENHGVGIHRALENLETIEEWLDPEAIPHEEGETISVVLPDVQIPMLFK